MQPGHRVPGTVLARSFQVMGGLFGNHQEKVQTDIRPGSAVTRT